MPKSTLYFLKYNDYYNRQAKGSPDLLEYLDCKTYELTTTAFNPRDGANTFHVLNVDDGVKFDYMVRTIEDAPEAVEDRWFVVDRHYTRAGQCTVYLRRDFLADYANEIHKATLLMQRGSLPQTSPMLYNSEGFTFNQIKKSEILLKDRGATAWAAFYLAPNFFGEPAEDKALNLAGDIAYDYAFATTDALLAAFPGSNLDGGLEPSATGYTAPAIHFDSDNPSASEPYNAKWTISPTAGVSYELQGSMTAASYKIATPRLIDARSYFTANMPTDAALVDALTADRGTVDGDLLLNADQTVARVGSGDIYKYYALAVARQPSTSITYTPTSGDETYTIAEALQSGSIAAGIATGTPSGTYTITAQVDSVVAVWLEVPTESTITLPATAPLPDAPYYIALMPWDSIQYIKPGGGDYITSSPTLTRKAVTAFAKQFGSYVYDIQLLPYFPDPAFVGTNKISFIDSDAGAVAFADQGNTFVYFAKRQTFSVSLNYSVPMWDNRKVQDATQLVRICSPNYAAAFDVSAAKNGGIQQFRADCTYKPYQPYIHVAPHWGGLYGTDFGDPRGLICSGDFSLPIVSDAWTEYQINNKNYQLMFDRQVETMDIKRGTVRANELFGALSGVRGGAVSGAQIGGGYGAAVGAALSVAGGIADIAISETMYQREREDIIKSQAWQLGNIQARPETLTKVGALNANNKVFPVVEIYEASDAEIDAFAAYVERRGCRLGIVGGIDTYRTGATNFIQGELLHINTGEDAKIADEIARELALGAYYDLWAGEEDIP